MIKRKIIDSFWNVLTYLFSSVGIIVLLLIFIFVFSNGSSTLSWKLITSDYNQTTYVLSYKDKYDGGNFEYKCKDDEYFSSYWGIAFTDTVNTEGVDSVIISYIDDHSPLLNGLLDVGNDNYHHLQVNQYVTTALLVGEEGNIISCPARKGAESMAAGFNRGVSITTLNLVDGGGGIRGSLIATLYLILFTLILVLPLGIAAAIYLSIYAKDNWLTHLLKSLIDMSSGVPSIIFGLVGLLLFVPMFNALVGSEGYSILAGALTMTIMLLPIVISTTKEAIDVIPKKIISGSLALGASQTQTTFKIILPNAIPGILTSTLLAIGRIIGESAAIIFVMGTQVQDYVLPNRGGTTLATHIYNLMGLENPNYKLASAIAIVILMSVLILNILVKLIGYRLNKFGRKH